MNRREANLKMISETTQIQGQSKDVVERIQKQLSQTEEIGGITLEEIRRQGNQAKDIDLEISSVNSKLDQSKLLQGKFDTWAGHWLGGVGRAARRDAAEINERSQLEHSQVKEVFQQEKFDPLIRKWTNSHLVLCNDTTLVCDELFDPTVQESLSNSNWSVVFSGNVDEEGWTYAPDLSSLTKIGSGSREPKWNSYVRRRQWKRVDIKAGSCAMVDEVITRNEERKEKQSAKNQLQKAGYFPRSSQNNTTPLTSTGFVHSTRKPSKDQELDSDSVAALKKVQENDTHINVGLATIDKQLDHLHTLAGTMNEEIKVQNENLEKIDNNMQRTLEKQTVVNAHVRQQLKRA